MTVGRTHTHYIIDGINQYLKRLKRYVQFSFMEIPDIKTSKSMSESVQKQKECDIILEKLNPSDIVILLDERGRMYDSIEFANSMERHMASGRKRLIFIIGGPYGFSADMYERADSKLSLSKMTFNHEMVRLFFVEQIYRAMTILRNEPYHHK